MDMRQLKYYVQIVESGSLSKASRQLFIAQSALSQQMARLEAEVGKPLLVRSVRGVIPTENGEALYHHAKVMLRQLDEAVFVARQDYSNAKGRVTLGLDPTTVSVLGLPLLKHVKEKYPAIVLNIVAMHSGYMEAMAQVGQLDIAIMFSHTSACDMEFEPLFDEELFVLVPADTKLVAEDKKSLTLAEAARLPLVLPRPGHGLRRRIDAEFERAQLLVDGPVAEIDALLLLMQYVAEGDGATIQPMSAMLVMNPAGRWRCLPISDTRMSRTNYLYALPRHKLSASASLVRTELKHVTRELIENFIWRGIRLFDPTAAIVPDSDNCVDE